MIDALSHDLRRADVEEADRLLGLADEAGLVRLPSLLAVDLCLFGGHKQAMFDEAPLGTWAALSGQARQELGGAAVAELVRRALLSRSPSRRYGSGAEATARYRMHPALAMILSTRAHPVWLAVTSVTATAVTGPRVYGMGSALEPRRAAVLEMPREQPATEPAPPDLAELGRIYDYTLASNAKAADLLAEWVLLPVPGDGGLGRQVDMYHHPEGRPLSRVRVSVQRDAYGARVSVGEEGAKHVLGDYDRKSLADHLHNVIWRFS
jgi:hypothetical protein